MCFNIHSQLETLTWITTESCIGYSLPTFGWLIVEKHSTACVHDKDVFGSLSMLVSFYWTCRSLAVAQTLSLTWCVSADVAGIGTSSFLCWMYKQDKNRVVILFLLTIQTTNCCLAYLFYVIYFFLFLILLLLHQLELETPSNPGTLRGKGAPPFMPYCNTAEWRQSQRIRLLTDFLEGWNSAHYAVFGHTMSAAEWKKRCEAEWGLQDAPMPDSLDWKSVYEAKPLGRNLLRNPAPHGTSDCQEHVQS